MGARLDEGTLRSYLERAVESSDPDVRQVHEDAFLTYLYTLDVFEVWGRSLARHYGRTNDWEEVRQVITEELISYIRQITPETVGSIDRIAAHLYFKAKTSVVRWLDSPAVTVASEMSGISRRYRQSMVARSEFVTKFEREPSDRELVEYINTKVTATRKNAAKQGALVSESDVSGRMLQSYSMDHQLGDGEGEGFGRPTEDSTVRVRGELSITTRRLAEIAEARFGAVTEPTVREVLHVWMEFVLDNEPPTVSSIAVKLQITRPLARERMRQVDSVLAILRGDQG
ncbi:MULTISPECIES: hypothetical protein [Microbacterium]|uniref:Uncharacterized protein n=1 Tax=Microbacterium hominis TaxID=162426 RepID=A0A2K9DJ76_9MICO|nr:MULTISPECIES: hypothetical protein [Microbacterium]AUG29547.1 hypothetical protein CXR34_08865 [Microbacterium hominis]EPD84248.1 hypothetical protein HMPREF1529_02313 [Microbacterium sp. oral taxon 186 str. F0373]